MSNNEYEQQQFWNILVIPDKNKVSKEEWEKYYFRLLNKTIPESAKTNYNLYYGK